MDLLESRLHVLLLGSLITCIFGAIWWNSQSRSMLILTLAGVIATGAGVAVEHLVVTPRETVEQTLYAIAAKIDSGNQAELLDYFHSSVPHMRAQAEGELTRWEVSEGKITHIHEITVDSERVPPRAVVRFNAGAHIGSRSIGISGQRVVLTFVVTFEEEDGLWKVLQYSWHDPHRRF